MMAWAKARVVALRPYCSRASELALVKSLVQKLIGELVNRRFLYGHGC